MCRVLASSQLVKKFSAFYGNSNLLNAPKGAYPPPVPILNQIYAVHASPSHARKINLNVIHSSMDVDEERNMSSANF